MTCQIQIDAADSNGTRLRSVHLPHAPQDAEKIVELRTSMLVNGWMGRPVILADAGDHHIALTGTHRLAAAQGIDGVIEAVYLPDDLTTEDWDEIDAAHDDDDVLTALREIAGRRDDGEMDEAIAAMEAEVAANAEAE